MPVASGVGLKLGLHAGDFCPCGIGAYHAGPNNIQKYAKKKKTVYTSLKLTFLVKIENKTFPLKLNSIFFKFSEALCT